jgi:hypothetical protein
VVALFVGRGKVDLPTTRQFFEDKVLVVSNGVMVHTRFEFFFLFWSVEAVWWPVTGAHGAAASHAEAEGNMAGNGAGTLPPGQKKEGVWLASVAHIGAELEATTWSATLTRMCRSWATAGRLAHHTGRESRGGKESGPDYWAVPK